MGRELRVTERTYNRNFIALFEAVEREQARRGDPLADRERRGQLVLPSRRVPR
jgi:hypothetical protein